MCGIEFVVFTDCESCTRSISTNPVSMEAGEFWANAWDVFFRAPSRCGRGRRAAVGFVVCFRWVGISFFFRFFFFERTRPAASMRTPCLIYLSASSGTLQHLYTKSSSGGENLPAPDTTTAPSGVNSPSVSSELLAVTSRPKGARHHHRARIVRFLR